MPTPTGVWVEFSPAHFDEDQDATLADTIVRAFSSEITALRSAMNNGNRVIQVEFGETIEQAIARENPTPDPRAAQTPTVKRRTAVERRRANGLVGDEAVNPPEADA
jgi:hypothetical protein